MNPRPVRDDRRAGAQGSGPIPPGLALALALVCAGLLTLGARRAVTVALTLPGFDAAAAGECTPGGNPCIDLDSIAFRGLIPGDPRPRPIFAESVTGRAGQHYLATLTIDSVTRIWAETRDVHGNAACASNTLAVAPTTAVPPASPARGRGGLYDVAGRRIGDGGAALRPGIYFMRDVRGGRGRAVVLDSASARRLMEATDGTAR